ncbi:dodecin family protein [Aquibium sp. A9E412]|uniref:dodecin family protein n=1 Tax=Aquibium sp. A9E412 TaxID=2976767 RepID=UPI0025B0686D|nr:dodecin family protein [Aquibium sp. A9E412]MDN2566106.1 dodecin family protein [Aquibium sp. A9E412]
MSIARITEINAAGSSIEDAIKNGVERANKTLDNIEQVWVAGIKARVEDGRVAEYRVDMKVTFILKD